MMRNRRIGHWVWSAALLTIIAPLTGELSGGENKGQADLDKAIGLKLTAENISQLGTVIDLCQSALDKGLDEANTDFAKKLLASTLIQRASVVSRQTFDALPADPRVRARMVQIRSIALADLERAIGLDPEQPQAHYLIGRWQAMPGGSRDRALQAIEEALRTAGDDAQVRSAALTVRAVLTEDPEKRMADHNEAVTAAPMSAEALRERGGFLIEQGKVEEGLADLERALELDPDHAGTHHVLGLALAMLKRNDEALASFDRAIVLMPESPMLYVRRAQVRLQKDDTPGAIADVDKALELDPGNAGMLLLRSRMYQQAGDNERALADLDAAIAGRPDFLDAVRARGLLLAQMNRLDDAITELEQASSGAPNDLGLLVQLASFYSIKRDFQKTVEAYTKALEIAPDNWMVYHGRADAYLFLKRQDLALADYESALKREPKSDSVLNNLAWLLATSPHDELRNGARAIELATSACEVTEYKKAHILSTLAAGYAETGDFESAIKWSTKAVELSTDQLKEPLTKELESYRAGKPWREAAPPSAEAFDADTEAAPTSDSPSQKGAEPVPPSDSP